MYKLGSITSNERDEVQEINNRKHALEELISTVKDISQNDELYNRIITDIVDTKVKLSEWWLRISSKYEWTFSAEDTWSVDYRTCDVFLIKH